jgi:dolichol-phosphate mannosyltransferase
MGSTIYYQLLDKFSDVKTPRNVGDFRLIDEKVLEKLKDMKEKSRYLRGMVAWLGFKYTFVDYHRPDRKKGESKYSLSKLAKLGMDGILNFSMLPLKVGFILGSICMVSSILFLAYMLVDLLIFGVHGYPLYKWLAVITLMLLGFQFMLIWILGEYIGRIYNEVRGRPNYIIRENSK